MTYSTDGGNPHLLRCLLSSIQLSVADCLQLQLLALGDSSL